MNQFEAAQKKIDLEQNARLVLLHMVQHQERNPSGSFSDGLIWTTKMISEHLRMSEPAATEVIQYLLRERLVERRVVLLGDSRRNHPSGNKEYRPTRWWCCSGILRRGAHWDG